MRAAGGEAVDSLVASGSGAGWLQDTSGDELQRQPEVRAEGASSSADDDTLDILFQPQNYKKTSDVADKNMFRGSCKSVLQPHLCNT